MLTKNQGSLTSYGLNNGAIGRVVSILYERGKSPPDFPQCVVVDFPSYSGPSWLKDHPTWIPIPPRTSRCDRNCCSRVGLPLIPCHALPIAKSQGMILVLVIL